MCANTLKAATATATATATAPRTAKATIAMAAAAKRLKSQVKPVAPRQSMKPIGGGATLGKPKLPSVVSGGQA